MQVFCVQYITSFCMYGTGLFGQFFTKILKTLIILLQLLVLATNEKKNVNVF